MDPRDLLSRIHIPQSLSSHPYYTNSIPVLGAYTLLFTIITYTIAKMFGFGSGNDFVVEGQVCYTCK